MDILHLVDRLEELFDESRPIWFTHSVMIDEDKILDFIDQMRVSIPEEIKKSQQLLAQSDRIIAKAKEEAAISYPCPKIKVTSYPARCHRSGSPGTGRTDHRPGRNEAENIARRRICTPG